MESGLITDDQITASSQYAGDHAAVQGRLHFKETNVNDNYKAGAWSALTSGANQWLQVDLGSNYVTVAGVATQGRNGYNQVQWVTKYNLLYSDDEFSFQYYKEQGQIINKVKKTSNFIMYRFSQA